MLQLEGPRAAGRHVTLTTQRPRGRVFPETHPPISPTVTKKPPLLEAVSVYSSLMTGAMSSLCFSCQAKYLALSTT